MVVMSNRLSLSDIRELPIGEVAALPADQLALLQEESTAALASAKSVAEWLEAAIALRYADRAQALRREQAKDAGTIRFDDGDITVVADLPKKVDWDQAQLTAIVQRIRAGGEDPADYVETAFKVPERKYAAWPKPIREAFTPARTVKTGKPSFELKLRNTS
jgi:hypothetical protein